MTPDVIISLVMGLINGAKALVEMARQIHGQDAIPTWEQILDDNAALQAKIDAEK
jgi:hypothetical protein